MTLRKMKIDNSLRFGVKASVSPMESLQRTGVNKTDRKSTGKTIS